MINVKIVSAFCRDGLGGNKAGVVTDAGNLTEDDMQRIASELGFSETAFIMPSDKADYRVRYFTPVSEVPLCGHATIAAFSLIKRNCTIETDSGILNILYENGTIFMEQNMPEFYQIIRDGDLPVQVVSTGLKDIMLPFESPSDLFSYAPDFEAIKEQSRKEEVIGIHAFALSSEEGIDAVCRNFAPLYGINEESATGTSNCALAGYLAKYHEKKDTYIFNQGDSLGQPSQIIVRLNDDSIYVGGKAVLLKEMLI